MVIGIGDVHVAVFVQRNARRRTELAVIHPFLPHAHRQEIGRRNRHDLLRLGAFPFRRDDRDDIVVTGPVREIVMDKRGLRAFDAGGLVLLHPDYRFEIVGACDRPGQLRKLDLDALRGLEIEVVIHGIRYRVPCNDDPPVSTLGCDIGRSGRKFFLLGNRIAGAPLALRSLNRHIRTIEPKHLIQQPCFDHRWCLVLLEGLQPRTLRLSMT